MSTRGAWGFIVAGRKKVTYNNANSYPTGLGIQIMKFIQNHTDAELTEIAKGIELVRENVPPTPEQIKNILSFQSMYEGDSGPLYKKEWEYMLSNVQGDPEYYADGLMYMVDGVTFLKDPLFCEWAYLIDTVRNVLRVMIGGEKRKRMRITNEIPFTRIRKLSNTQRQDIAQVIENEQYADE